MMRRPSSARSWTRPSRDASCIAARRRSSSPSTSRVSSSSRPSAEARIDIDGRRRRRGAGRRRHRAQLRRPDRGGQGQTGLHARRRAHDGAGPEARAATPRRRGDQGAVAGRQRPTTAVQTLDQIEDLLRRMGQRTLDLGRLVGVRGYTRVTYPAPTWDDLLALGVDEIRDVRRRLAPGRPPAAAPAREPRRDGDCPSAGPRCVDRLDRLDVAIATEIPAPDLADARVPDPQGLGLSRPAPRPEPAPGRVSAPYRHLTSRR